MAVTPKSTPRKGPRTLTKRRVTASPRRTTARRRLNFSAGAGSSAPYMGRTSKVGFPTGTATALRRITVDTWTGAISPPSKTLVLNELTVIPRKTGTEINARERDMINCLGFNVRATIRSTSETNMLCVRMAVVSPIDKTDADVTEWFRGYGNTRGEAFQSLLDSSQILHNPINRDRYAVLWEKKFTLGPTNDATSTMYTRNINACQVINEYIPLNRQLRYDTGAGSDCADKVFLAFWYDTPEAPGAAVPNSLALYQRFAVAYWKDP